MVARLSYCSIIVDATEHFAYSWGWTQSNLASLVWRVTVPVQPVARIVSWEQCVFGADGFDLFVSWEHCVLVADGSDLV